MMHRRSGLPVGSSAAVADGVVLEEASSSSITPQMQQQQLPQRSTRRRARRLRTAAGFRKHYGNLWFFHTIAKKSDVFVLVGTGLVLVACAAVICVKVWSGGGTGGGRTTLSFMSPEESFMYGLEALEWNPIYRVPEASPYVGDRSDDYALLRQEVDAVLPKDPSRSLSRIADLKSHSYTPMPMKKHHHDSGGQQPPDELEREQVPYDIYDCPDTPPRGYPFHWNLRNEVLAAWPADDPAPRERIHQGLCVFDYQKEREKARLYRKAEVPFVVVNDPAVAATAERWNVPGYLEACLGPHVQHRVEYSENNHFMYWQPPAKGDRNKKKRGGRNQKRRPPPPPDWKPPTEHIRLTYNQWLKRANVSDDKLGPDQPHWYFRLIGCGALANDGSCDKGSSEYLYDELPYFQPREDSLYIVDPEETKGIHCRFGMKGVVAENHFDASRNFIVLLGGQRRYILSNPDQCDKLALYPKGHPSARHSAVDWSDPDLTRYPEFDTAMANEVVMQPGQVLYLPTNWFHFIISLDLNFQCNTRSGASDDYPLEFCGF